MGPCLVLWAARTDTVCHSISAGGWLAGTTACLVSGAGLKGYAVICIWACELLPSSGCVLCSVREWYNILLKDGAWQQSTEKGASVQRTVWVARQKGQFQNVKLRRRSHHGTMLTKALMLHDHLLGSIMVQMPSSPDTSQHKGGSTLHAVSCLPQCPCSTAS